MIGQLLNCFYRLGINENYLKVNDNFIERIPSIEIQSSLANFVKKTKDTNVERNAFTHRFTPTSADFRVTKTVKKEKDGVSFYEPENIKIETFVKNSEEMLEHLSDLLSKLTKEVR